MVWERLTRDYFMAELTAATARVWKAAMDDGRWRSSEGQRWEWERE